MSAKNSKTECAPLDWEQFLLLCDRLRKSNEHLFHLLIAIGCYCGLRINDILQIRWIDLLNKQDFEVTEKKTGKWRKITLNESLQTTIQLCYDKIHDKRNLSISNFIFINRNGKVLTRQYVNRKLHMLFQQHRVKCANPSSHTLRKTFGMRVYEVNNRSEAALVLLSSVFNHNSISVTRRYIGLSQQQIDNAYLNL